MANYKILIVMSLLFGFIANANSYEIQNYKYKLKTKQLPGFCAYVRFANWGGPGWRKYVDKFGEDWEHMHHVCWGIDKTNEVLKKGPNYDWFKSEMRDAISEFDYSLNRIKNKKLKMIALNRKVFALNFLNNYSGIIKCYSEMIKVDKNNVGAYIALSNTFLFVNNKKKAKEVLFIGLKHNPESIKLKNQIAKLK